MASGILTISLPGPATSGAECPSSVFVAGPENHLAAVAMRPYLDKAPTPWNPLVLYGPHGSGKSHLAQGRADATDPPQSRSPSQRQQKH